MHHVLRFKGAPIDDAGDAADFLDGGDAARDRLVEAAADPTHSRSPRRSACSVRPGRQTTAGLRP